jgi:hypothetical protein
MAITHPSPEADSRRVLWVIADGAAPDLLAEALVGASEEAAPPGAVLSAVRVSQGVTGS